MKLNQDTLETIIETTPGPPPPPWDFRPACVSLLFFGEEETSILGILKADRRGYTWRNQVALPGGRVDDTDESPRHTAVRELAEELNIAAENVSYAGSLGHFQTLENTVIQVFAGTWNQQDEICYDPQEIARVLAVPLEALVKTHIGKGLHGRFPDMSELLYPVDNVVIWGVTAKILHFFLEALYPRLQS